MSNVCKMKGCESPPEHDGETIFIANVTVKASWCDVLTGYAALSQATQKCLRDINTRQVTETILHHLSPEPNSAMP